MKDSKLARYEARAVIAKALSHPTRLLLLDVLEGKERCVLELTEFADADQSVISKHLAILKNAGLVTSRRQGTMSLYRVNAPCLRGFWKCLDSVLRRNLESQRAAVGSLPR